MMATDQHPTKLEHILADEGLAITFRNFLHKTACGENLSFWLEVELLKELDENEQRSILSSIARKVFEKYFSPNSEYEVNVDQDVRVNLEKAMAAPTVHSFDAAQDYARYLLESDCMPKFIRSEMYKNYLEERKKHPRIEAEGADPGGGSHLTKFLRIFGVKNAPEPRKLRYERAGTLMLMNDWRHFKGEDDAITKDKSPSRRDASPGKAATVAKRDKSPLDRTVRDSGKREKSPSDRPIRESGGDGSRTPEPKDGGGKQSLLAVPGSNQTPSVSPRSHSSSSNSSPHQSLEVPVPVRQAALRRSGDATLMPQLVAIARKSSDPAVSDAGSPTSAGRKATDENNKARSPSNPAAPAAATQPATLTPVINAPAQAQAPAPAPAPAPTQSPPDKALPAVPAKGAHTSLRNESKATPSSSAAPAAALAPTATGGDKKEQRATAHASTEPSSLSAQGDSSYELHPGEKPPVPTRPKPLSRAKREQLEAASKAEKEEAQKVADAKAAEGYESLTDSIKARLGLLKDKQHDDRDAAKARHEKRATRAEQKAKRDHPAMAELELASDEESPPPVLSPRGMVGLVRSISTRLQRPEPEKEEKDAKEGKKEGEDDAKSKEKEAGKLTKSASSTHVRAASDSAANARPQAERKLELSGDRKSREPSAPAGEAAGEEGRSRGMSDRFKQGIRNTLGLDEEKKEKDEKEKEKEREKRDKERKDKDEKEKEKKEKRDNKEGVKKEKHSKKDKHAKKEEKEKGSEVTAKEEKEDEAAAPAPTTASGSSTITHAEDGKEKNTEESPLSPRRILETVSSFVWRRERGEGGSGKNLATPPPAASATASETNVGAPTPPAVPVPAPPAPPPASPVPSATDLVSQPPMPPSMSPSSPVSDTIAK